MSDQAQETKSELLAERLNDTSVVMTMLLIGSLLNAVLGLVAISRGQISRGPFALFVAVIAFFAVARFAGLGWMVRTGVAVIGLGASIRCCTYYLHASRDIRHLAEVNGWILSVAGCTLVVIGALRWFRARSRTISN